MSPRQFRGWLALANEDEGHDAAQSLTIAAMGARSAPRDIEKAIASWLKP